METKETLFVVKNEVPHKTRLPVPARKNLLQKNCLNSLKFMSYSSDLQRFSSLALRSSSRLAKYEARGLRNLGVPHLYEDDRKRMGKNECFPNLIKGPTCFK